MKPTVLVLISLSDEHQKRIAEHYELVYAPKPESRARAIAERPAGIKVLLTNGTTGVTGDEINALPDLELLCALGVGFENLDLEAARARGIALANGAGTNAACVADHAMGLLLANVRQIVLLDKITREGQWRETIDVTPGFSGKKLGLLGMGMIAQQIARRAAGFDLEIAYHSRTQRDEVPYAFFDTPAQLAAWADFLIVATPGGNATRHMVNADVLKALGPRGYLVNIARGSVVDTAALVDILKAGQFGGASLDVYEGEPKPPRALFDFPNVVLTPHVGGWSPESISATIDRFLDNAQRHFSGKPMISPL